MTPDWIACDWGTSNLRLWAMAGGDVVAEAESDRGMGSLAPGDFEGALRDAMGDWAPAPVVACGMVGARQGWTEAPYAAVPCPPLAGPLKRVPGTDLSVHIVPGLKQDHPGDVMRGEETQIAGFLSMNADWDGVVCLPGTHTKWVHVSAGEVVSFQTVMTGELFSLLARKSVLRHAIAEGWDEAAFETAVGEALTRPERVSTELFGIRAAFLLHDAPTSQGYARLSGLLIGSELAATRNHWLGREIAIIGAHRLAGAYRLALSYQGAHAMEVKPGPATLAGLREARALVD